jgi:hypothetical protein
MSLSLKFLDICVPEPLKKRILRDIFSSTAQAFDAALPDIKGLSSGRLLETYAHFTRSAAEEVSTKELDPEAVRLRLFQNASDLGSTLRKRFHLRSREDVLKMSRIIYKILGISLEGRADGQVIIRSCFFSRFYTAEVCRLISALDEGAAAGLSGGGRLEFSRRMTEGYDCCRGYLRFKDEGP